MGFEKPDFKWRMEGRAQAALNEGINLLDEGKPNLAITELGRAIVLVPKEWIVYYFLGVAYKQTREPRAAVRMFQTASKLNGSNFYVDMELGKCYELMKRAEEALRAYGDAAMQRKGSPLPHYMMGNIYVALRDLPRAERAYKEARKIDPNFLDGEVKIAQIEAFAKNRVDAAVKILDDVLLKDSVHQQALIFHGLITSKTNSKASLHDFDALVRLNPGNPLMRLLRGLARIEIEDFDGAFGDLRRVLEATSNQQRLYSGQQSQDDRRLDIEYAGFYVMSHIYSLPDEQASKVRQAFCLMLIASYDPALRVIRSIPDFPTSPLCTLLEAIAAEHSGNHNKAFQLYERALYLDNDIPDAHKKRGIYRMELKDYTGAESDFTDILRINPEDVVAYRFRGLSRYHRQQYVQAIEDFNKYLLVDSLEIETLIARGLSYKSLDKNLEANLDLLRAGEQRQLPSFDKVKAELNILVAKGDTTQAIVWMRRFITANPKGSKTRMHLINLYLTSKNWNGALNEAKDALEAGKMDLPSEDINGSRSYLPEVSSFFYFTIGTSLVNLKQEEGALEALNNAIELDQTNGKAFLERSKILRRRGKTSAADKDLAKARKLGEVE